ncbi:MAG: 2-C-methyl-D-erythritol 4-phosphate cytidylyltransferase [Spirochaetales bacterium]|nr:2-C-methyl-D-erythritol 4-phosphate cytidylyltransferase [Spirochaetales bacterium]
MQGGTKKEYRILGQKPVLVHSIFPFILSGLFYKVVVTLPENDIVYITATLSRYMDTTRVCCIGGGVTRQESVYFALKEFEQSAPEYILIHDGARPWIQANLINRVLEATFKFGACIPVVEIPDALKEIDEKGFINKSLCRDTIKGAQTPQGFLFSRIYQAHLAAREQKREALDDAEVYSLLFHPVATVQGDVENRKITYTHDLF